MMKIHIIKIIPENPLESTVLETTVSFLNRSHFNLAVGIKLKWHKLGDSVMLARGMESQ